MDKFLFVLMFVTPYFLFNISALSMKWNVEMDKSMFASFWVDFDSLKKKLLKLNMSNEFIELLAELERSPPKSALFNRLQIKFNSEWNKKCQDLTFGKVLEICEKSQNKDKCCDFFHLIFEHFRDSIEASFLHTPFNMINKVDSKRISRAIACLNLVNPTAFIGQNGKVNYIELKSFFVNSGKPEAYEPTVPDTFYSVYNVTLPDGEKPVVSRFGHFKPGNYMIKPKIDYLSEDHFKTIFGRDFCNLTMFEFSSLKMKIKNNILIDDPNYNLETIFRQVISEEVYDFCYIIDRMTAWLPRVCRIMRGNLLEDDLNKLALEGPFSHVQNIQDFKHPFWLLKSSFCSRKSTSDLIKDYETLESLMKLFQSEVEKGIIEV